MRSCSPTPALLLALAVAGCGSSPPRGAAGARALLSRGEYEAAERAAERELARDPANRELWRVRIRAPMERGDSARGVDRYLAWHHLRHRYDDAALRDMAVAVLGRCLADPAPAVRRQAIEAVARLRLARLRGRVAQRLDDRDPTVAAAAAVALAGGDRRARARALALAAHPDPRVRAIAIAGWARAGGGAAVLVAALEDRAPPVRQAAARGLGRLRAAGDRLREVARADADGPVRAAALAALAGRRSAATLAVARAGLADGYLGARLAALALVADHGEIEALSAAAGSADAWVALRAAVALRKAGREPPTAALEAALRSRDWPLRAAALNAVVEIAPGEAARALAGPLVDDPRPEVALAAARVMTRLGRSAAAADLCYRLLEGPREDQRLSAALQLAEQGDPRGTSALAALGKSRDPGIRLAVAHGYRSADNVTLPLVGMLADPDAAVRLAAAEVMLGLL